EGWANVILEAMACGLPVVASDVGGNAEVVCDPRYGSIYDFAADDALFQALSDALERDWDRTAIVDYARANGWEQRVRQLTDAFLAIHNEQPAARRLAATHG